MPLSKTRDRDRKRAERAPNIQPNPMTLGTRRFLSFDDRLMLLAEIALTGNQKLTNPVEAVKEYNRMTGAYPTTPKTPPNVTLNITYYGSDEKREIAGIIKQVTQAQALPALPAPDESEESDGDT